MSIVEQTEFIRLCDDDGVCHCDWRLTISNCPEGKALRIMYIVEAIGSCVFALLDFRSGIPRPKPIESMACMGVAFHVVRLIQACIIITDAAPNNIAFRSWIFEFGWQCVFGAITCYLFGIAHTLSTSSKVIYDNWIHSPYIIDGAFFVVTGFPFISNNICAILGGIYIDQKKFELANTFTSALYHFWTFYTCFLGILLLYAGLRLLRLLRRHFINKPGVTDDDLKKFSLGALKVKIIVVTAFSCIMIFAVIVILYASYRYEIILYKPYNVGIGIVVTFNGIVGTGFVLFGIILNPKVATLTGLVTSSSGGNDNTTDTSVLRGSRMSKWLSSKAGASTIATPNTTVGVESSPKLPIRLPAAALDKKLIADVESGRTPESSRHHYQQSIELVGQTQSCIEEERLQYNAMISSIRAPQRTIIPYNTE
ncbi:hypothetical protein INT45_010608 [Circinella minor]|uniref:Uncharacterized protein n=1 Tax=Circinella minor TaxID=1195481 RepID=A0A8H7S082_9FUNG|nr:hypothetical protein INT45_010608 [Circinella minor]